MIDQNVEEEILRLKKLMKEAIASEKEAIVTLPYSNDPSTFNYRKGILDGLNTALGLVEYRIARMKEKFDEDNEDEFTS